MRTPIYVVGYPRSGNSHMAWLLGDLLDSPIEPKWNAVALATEGAERQGNYVIHQLHLRIDEGISTGEAVQNAWTYAPKRWRGEKVVFVARDPRAVAVSAMHYWEIPSLKETMLAMDKGTPPFHGVGSWNAFNRGWLPYCWESGQARLVTYEELAAQPLYVLGWLLELLGAPASRERIQEALARQSIESKRAQVEKDGDTRPYGRAIQLKHLRKGDPYDWKNYFNDELLKLAKELFGDVMGGLGYA